MIAEITQSTAATQPPRAMMEPQSPMSRKPGFAIPITNPSHQRIVLSRRRSSTATSAIHPPLARFPADPVSHHSSTDAQPPQLALQLPNLPDGRPYHSGRTSSTVRDRGN